MEFIACIGRLNPAAALTVVCELLSQSLDRFVMLSSQPSVTELQSAVVNEELFWIVSFAGYLVANKSSGELPRYSLRPTHPTSLAGLLHLQK